MNSTAGFASSFDLDYPGCSRWSYSTSDARSEPLPPQRPSQTISSPSHPSPPPQPSPPPPKEIETGVWLQDDDILYACNYPRVQQYLAQIREERRMVDPPSDIIWTLAALDVLYDPHDVAHWIFWSQEAPDVYKRHAESVDKIALHRPRIIKSRVPWTGSTQYIHTVARIQEKWRYVHANHQWYPTTAIGKSESGEELVTGKQFFRLANKDCRCTVCAEWRKEAKAKAKAKKDSDSDSDEPALKSKSKSKAKKTKKKVVKKRTAPTTLAQEDILLDAQSTTLDESPVPLRLSTRLRRPTERSPRIFATILESSSSKETLETGDLSHHILSSSSFISSPSSPPSHSRSTSQSSVQTLVANNRCSSVESSETAIGASPSKKRKADQIEKDHALSESTGAGGELGATETEGMVTRRRARIRAVDSEQSLHPSRTSTPAMETKAKPALAWPTRGRPKKVRV